MINFIKNKREAKDIYNTMAALKSPTTEKAIVVCVKREAFCPQIQKFDLVQQKWEKKNPQTPNKDYIKKQKPRKQVKTCYN